MILENDGRQVRIGIDAPRQVAVHRDEVYRKIQAGAGQVAEVNGNR